MTAEWAAWVSDGTPLLACFPPVPWHGRRPANNQNRCDVDGCPYRAPGVEITKGQAAMQVFVRDNDINSALRVLKKKMQREGTFREMKRRRAYEKPSERRAREQAEAVRRHRKMLRKRLEREGY
jgi:small subunit ribosomal protein S21